MQSLFVVTLFLTLVVLCFGEKIVDRCEAAPGSGRELESLISVSSNIVVDTANRDNYDGDSSRFKRRHNAAGHVSYISQRGIQRLEVNGFVFSPSVNRTWSLSVTFGENLSRKNSTRDPYFRMTESNVSEYQVNGGKNEWKKFRFILKLRGICPRRVNLILEGNAGNNEHPGWGLQLAEIELENSWYERCVPKCRVHEAPCALDQSLKRFVDQAKDFYSMTSRSRNIQIDRSNAARFHNNDNARFKRSNARAGQIVYAAPRGIRVVRIEFFQYEPFNTRLALFPYLHQGCQPIRLEPVMENGTGPTSGGWVYKVALFDLRSLPFCPRHASIHISGGSAGWELQISRVILTVLGEVSQRRRPEQGSGQRSGGGNVYQSSSSSSTRSQSDSGSSGGVKIAGWAWAVILGGAALVFLFVTFVLRMSRVCLGDDERHVYHISNWIPAKWSKNRGVKDLGPGPPVVELSTPKLHTQYNSFSFTHNR